MSYTGYFADYDASGAWDEMVSPGGGIRTRFLPVYNALNALGSGLEQRAEIISTQYLEQGVTFDFAGMEQPFPLDIVPRIITEGEWNPVEAGVKQRIRALEAFLDDVYTEQRCIKDGVIPPDHLISSPDLLRQAWNTSAGGNNVRIHVAGIDLVRDIEGTFRVLEDNVRVPSGVSYVLSNRRAMVQAFPELFSEHEIMRVDDYPRKLLAALQKSAPHGNLDPTVVLLTPGVYNSAYFEHSLLARLMGIPLVEGRDLFCSGGYVWMHTTEGPKRVDVIYRRIDDVFIDPVHFRMDSIMGIPGLINASIIGNVTIANAVGNGIADDKLTYTYVPDFIRYYLGEEPIIPNVDTYRLEKKSEREHVFANLREFVIKPVNGSGGKGIVVGGKATDEELRKVIEEVDENPRNWIAQPTVSLSTSPTWIAESKRFEPRHVDLRPFAVNSGDDIYVLPGGLTRVALPKGQLIVNSSQGGGSKDTWVKGWSAGPRAIADVMMDAANSDEVEELAEDGLLSFPIMSNPKDFEEIEYEQQQQ